VNLASAGAGRSTRADVRLVEEALERGVRLFDTADVYGAGASERVLGRALRGRRSEVVVATKGGYVFRERTRFQQSARRAGAGVLRRIPMSRRRSGGSMTRPGADYAERDESSRYLRAAVEGSLRRLRTDYIDVYQLHGPSSVDSSIFDELQDLEAAGKVRGFGVGAESVAAATEWLAVPAVRTVQVPFGVLDPEAVDLLFPHLEARPVELWARGVLGGGLLALTERDPVAVAAHDKAPRIERLHELARRSGRAIDDLAIGYVRSFRQVSALLVGISSSAHLRRNLELMESPAVDEHLLQELEEIGRTPLRDPDARS
jgi:1-deoxyxylulose-5-phosphate synthase